MRRWAGSLVKGLLLLWIAGTMACAAGAPISTAEPPPTPDFRTIIEEEVKRILSAQSKSPCSISSPDLMPDNTPENEAGGFNLTSTQIYLTAKQLVHV